MGAWGTGPFENDDALDFAASIGSLSDLQSALDELEGIGDEPEVDLAARIVVVAECVAAMHGHPHQQLPAELAAILAPLGKPSPDLFEAARNALSGVISRSELSDLWGESEERGAYNREIIDLIDRLNRPVAPSGSTGGKAAGTNNSPCWFCGEEMGGEFTSIQVALGEQSAAQLGGSVHLACLNAALHPRYIVQDWKFDDAAIDELMNEIFGDEASD